MQQPTANEILDSTALARSWAACWYARMAATATIMDPDLADDLEAFCTRLVGAAGRTEAEVVFGVMAHAQRVFDPARTRLGVERTQHHGIQALADAIIDFSMTPRERLDLWTSLTSPWLTHAYFAIASLDELGDATDQSRALGLMMRHLWLLAPREDIRVWRALPGDTAFLDIARTNAPATAEPAMAALLDRVVAAREPTARDGRLLAPLYAGDEPFAIIDVALPPDEAPHVMLQVLALALATTHALSTVAQHQQATPSVIWQRVLTSLAQMVTEAESVEAVILTVAQHVRQALPCERIAFWTYHPETRTFRLDVLSARITNRTLPVGTTCDTEDTPLQVAWHTGQPLLLDEHWPSTFPGFPNASESIHDMAVVPLVYDLSALGVLTIERLEHRPFTHQDTDWLMVVGGIAASSLHALRMRASLREAQHRATEDQKMRALGEMAAGIAHDFNNLLMALLCHVELMGIATEMRQIHSRLPHLERAITDGRAIVQRVSTFGRRAADVPMAPVRLDQMLQDVAALHHPQFAPQGVVCELRCVENIWVAGNAPELREVVTNLVTNAVQAMPDGGTLTLACDSRGDGTAWFSVRDTGIGMPPPVAARACEPFFSTKGGMGTGLGLAVSYQIIHRHGGTLAIDSTEGAGTTISADLPAVAAPTSPVASVAQSGPPLRILFVEDHPDIAEMLTHMLRRLGHGTVHAATVEEGARLCAETRPDLVITDFAVGDAFGDVVAHAAAMLAPPIPVILISGSAQPAEGHEHLYAAVLQKPVLMEIVQSAIQYVLAR